VRRSPESQEGGTDGLANVGDLFVDLKLEGLDAAQIDDLGEVTDENSSRPDGKSC
jgi:hypothetical protein